MKPAKEFKVLAFANDTAFECCQLEKDSEEFKDVFEFYFKSENELIERIKKDESEAEEFCPGYKNYIYEVTFKRKIVLTSTRTVCVEIEK